MAYNIYIYIYICIYIHVFVFSEPELLKYVWPTCFVCNHWGSTDLKWPRTPQNDSELPCWCLLLSIHGNEDTPPTWPMSVAAVDTEVPSPFQIHFLFPTTILLETHHLRSHNFSRIFRKIVCRYLLKTHLRLVEFEHGDGIFRPIYFT